MKQERRRDRRQRQRKNKVFRQAEFNAASFLLRLDRPERYGFD